MNTKRMILCALVLTLLCWSSSALAVNTIIVESKSVAKGETGVRIPVYITNDVDVKGIIVPLALRELTPGAFITSMTMSFEDRLPPTGPLATINFRNQYAEEDGSCKSDLPGGFGTITSATGGPNPVVASPEGVLFVRQRLFPPDLPPGADVTGSYVMTVDVTSVDGTFEIDTTCADPASHILYVLLDNTGLIPDFTKGVITIGEGGSQNNPPTAVCQDVTVDADANCEAAVTPEQVNNGSSDPDGDPITLALEPAGPFTAGVTPVQLIVTDDSGDVSHTGCI